MSRDTQAVMFLRARDLGPQGHDRAAEDRQIALQWERCQAVADDMGLTIIREYAEHGGTGSLDERPVLMLMLDELTALHDAAYVITYGLDRLARRSADLERLTLDLDTAGAELLVANQPYYTRQRVALPLAAGLGARP
jgi:DNA invertase Pin-like site-specific DNA recombinase